MAAEAEAPESLELVADAGLEQPEQNGERPGQADNGGDDARGRSRRRRGKRGGRRRNRQREGQDGLPQGERAAGADPEGDEPEFETPGAEEQDWDGEPETAETDSGGVIVEQQVAVEEVSTEPEWRLTPDRVAEAQGEDDPEPKRAERGATPIDVVTEPEPGAARKRGWWNRLVR